MLFLVILIFLQIQILQEIMLKLIVDEDELPIADVYQSLDDHLDSDFAESGSESGSDGEE